MYHGINGVTADASLLCMDCAFKEYGNLENMKRVVTYLKVKEAYGFTSLPRGVRRYEYNGEKSNRTLKEAFEYGLWYGLMIDQEGYKIGYIDDYNFVWEGYTPEYCEDCHKELDTVVLHTEDPEYGCMCEDCSRKSEEEAI